MPVPGRIVAASLLLAAAAGLALPVLVGSSSAPPLVSRVELGGPVPAGAVTGEGAGSRPREPVPVVPRGDRRDDQARSNVEDDDERDDADDDDNADGGDDGPGDTGRSAAGGDDTDDGGSSGD